MAIEISEIRQRPREMTEKNEDSRDFRNCAWSLPVKNAELVWNCKRKKLQFRVPDLGIGVCPCRYWVHGSKAVKKESGKSLF